MVTKKKWDELYRKVAAWEKWRLEDASRKAKRTAEVVQKDAKVDPDDLHKPATILGTGK